MSSLLPPATDEPGIADLSLCLPFFSSLSQRASLRSHVPKFFALYRSTASLTPRLTSACASQALKSPTMPARIRSEEELVILPPPNRGRRSTEHKTLEAAIAAYKADKEDDAAFEALETAWQVWDLRHSAGVPVGGVYKPS